MMPARGAPSLRSCVWELTLACNAKCLHCGSAAGRARANELSTAEALALIQELARLECQSVTLSGGEPLLRDDWPQLATAIRHCGMQLELITNGLVVAEQAHAIAQAGFSAVTFSVDGPADVHDRLRGSTGHLARLLAGVRVLAEHQLRLGAVTQVNRLNVDRLTELHGILVEHGISGWQVQLTMPLGRASLDLCLPPAELPGLAITLVELIQDGRIFVQAADNIGYMCRHEPVLRAGTGQPGRFWTGCQAGLQVVGITSDGSVRGCLSLPPAFDEGTLRQRCLAEIWADPRAFAFNRRPSKEALHEPCASCAFADICRGGCKSLSYAAKGGVSYNPYCLSYLTGRSHAEAP